MLAALICLGLTIQGGDPDELEAGARAQIGAGRFDRALLLLDRIPEPARSRPAEKLRARCLFELGDHPACERILRDLLGGAAAGPERAEVLAQLARVLSFQDAHDEALARIAEALRETDAPALHRLAIPLCLRALRHGDVLPHAGAILAASPGDPFARFARGIALARAGRHEEALPDLRAGLEVPDVLRDARLELALALGKLGRPDEALPFLLDILAADPYDAEACHQASRQLLRKKAPAAARTAALLVRYFQGLQEALGQSTRDQHMLAAGQASQAALLRAARWERVGAFDRVLSELDRAEALAAGSPTAACFAVDLWARLGLLAEAEAVLGSLPAGRAGTDGAPPAAEARARIAARREELLGAAGTPLGKARLEAAGVRWEDSGPALARLLAAADTAGDGALADRAARLLLARDPSSAGALAHLVERTAGPELLVPRIHYLGRLARLRPDRSAELAAARRTFLGED